MACSVKQSPSGFLVRPRPALPSISPAAVARCRQDITMACSVKQFPWCPSGFLVRPRSPLPSISPAAVARCRQDITRSPLPSISPAAVSRCRQDITRSPLPSISPAAMARCRQDITRSPLPSISPAAVARCRQPCLSLEALHLSPAHAKKKSRLLFKCSAGALNTIEKMIMDTCCWNTSYLPEFGFRTSFILIILVASNYAAYNLGWSYALSLFPYPLCLSAIYLTFAFLCAFNGWMRGWMKGDYPFPDTDLDFWKSLFPVAVAHTVGHVATIVSLSKSSAFFTETMRCGEPVFSVLLSSWFLSQGKSFPSPVYLSLFQIIGGCSIVALTEPNFNITGFISAMIANIAFASMNVIAERAGEEEGKKKKKGKEITGFSYGGCLSLLSLVILTPFAYAIEGPRLWIPAWQKATSLCPGKFMNIILLQAIAYGHHVEEVVYKHFPAMDPFSFITVSTMKKIFLIIAALAYYKSYQPINALGAAMTILGFLLYSRELCKGSRIPSWYL